MTPEQVFGKLNKDIKGITSGVASASVSNSSIIFTMNDGSTQKITFPTPKDTVINVMDNQIANCKIDGITDDYENLKRR